ncbi:MAG TPA: hypothetical protein VD906_07475 [Caulobacteraceae bacterium]|nr:hypothetical protein [Caulobacteraceae bacterium]
MTAVLYPVAPNAEAALNAPVGKAAREREAKDLAGRDVEFVSEDVGPAFETAEAAEAAFAKAVETGTVRVREVVAKVKGRTPVVAPIRPVFEGGRRWPKVEQPLAKTVWRLSISYWRIVDPARYAELEQARKARKAAAGEQLDPGALRVLSRQPLRAVKPQQPLDVGLFEYRLPEAPDIVIPDE